MNKIIQVLQSTLVVDEVNVTNDEALEDLYRELYEEFAEYSNIRLQTILR
jgi:hypothetical protein